jgi:hypothetical protein
MSLQKTERHYLHGDVYEDDPNKVYCARCDLFAPIAHFHDREQHSPSDMSDYDRYERMRKNFKKSKKNYPSVQRTRPTNAPNIFA